MTPKKPKSQAAVKWRERSRQRQKEEEKKETEWRTAVLLRDGYKCRYPACCEVGRSLHAHHISPRSRRPDLKYVVSNGATLCFRHHDFVHMNSSKGVALALLSTRTMELARKEGTLGKY